MLYYPENDAYYCYSKVPEEIIPLPSRREIKFKAGVSIKLIGITAPINKYLLISPPSSLSRDRS